MGNAGGLATLAGSYGHARCALDRVAGALDKLARFVVVVELA